MTSWSHPIMAHTLLPSRSFTYRSLQTLLLPHFTLSTNSFNFNTPPHAAAMESSSPAAATNSTSTDTTINAESGQPAPDSLVQYVVLRRDLIDTWPLGSVVTQGCHASVAAVWAHKDDPHTHQYCLHLDSMHKVTLEVKGETQLLNLMEKLKENSIDHKLWIEQPENIPTCLATKPYPKSIVSSYFRRLKLCK